MIEIDTGKDLESQRLANEGLQDLFVRVREGFLELCEETPKEDRNTIFYTSMRQGVKQFYRYYQDRWDGEDGFYLKKRTIPECLQILEYLNNIKEVPPSMQDRFWTLKNYMTSYLLDQTTGTVQVETALLNTRNFVTKIKSQELEVQKNLQKNAKSIARDYGVDAAKVTQGHDILQKNIDETLKILIESIDFVRLWHPVTVHLWKVNNHLRTEIAETKTKCAKMVNDVKNETENFRKYEEEKNKFEKEKAEVARLKDENERLNFALKEAKKRWYHVLTGTKGVDIHDLLTDLNEIHSCG